MVALQTVLENAEMDLFAYLDRFFSHFHRPFEI